jgi:hypothetical protein
VFFVLNLERIKSVLFHVGFKSDEYERLIKKFSPPHVCISS